MYGSGGLGIIGVGDWGLGLYKGLVTKDQG